MACFDTAFHRTQPAVAQAFALPRRYAEEGVRRYGFHGLSYEYIASVLPAIDAGAAGGRTVVAHLGNGASMCAMRGGRSVATTMSFTALDGLVMGTRCGAIDPGVLLYLMERHGMDAAALEQLLYEESGLLGVSGVSSDMRELLEQLRSPRRRGGGPLRLPHRARARLARGGPRRASTPWSSRAASARTPSPIRARVCREARVAGGRARRGGERGGRAPHQPAGQPRERLGASRRTRS